VGRTHNRFSIVWNVTRKKRNAFYVTEYIIIIYIYTTHIICTNITIPFGSRSEWQMCVRNRSQDTRVSRCRRDWAHNIYYYILYNIIYTAAGEQIRVVQRGGPWYLCFAVVVVVVGHVNCHNNNNITEIPSRAWSLYHVLHNIIYTHTHTHPHTHINPHTLAVALSCGSFPRSLFRHKKQHIPM